MMKNVFVLILIVFVAGCGEKPAPEVLRPVRTQAVMVSSGEQQRTFSGLTSAGLEAALSFKVGGTILQKHVQEGDRVMAGDVLMSLDATDYQLQAQQNAADLQQAQAALRKDEANYKRIKTLYENQNASRNDLDTARASFESSRSSVDALTKRLELAQLQISYAELKAPHDGIIAGIHAEINEFVSSGTKVIDLNSEGDFDVTIGMPESLVSRVQQGAEVLVRFPSIDQQTFSGVVKTVSFVANDASTYPVKIQITEPSQQIRPGMSADVTFSFRVSSEEDVVIVPANSVAQDDSGHFVFVVKPDASEGVGVIEKRAVGLGQLTAEGFVITSGLAAGDQIVTAGISKITHAMKVKLLP